MSTDSGKIVLNKRIKQKVTEAQILHCVQ